MEGGGRSNLDRLANALLSASERIEAGGSLPDAEVRVLQALQTALPEDGGRRTWRWALAAAAFLLLLLGSGYFAATFYWKDRNEGIPTSIELAMESTGAARSGGEWRLGDLFTIEASISEDLYLHVLHLDAEGKLELVFPLEDPGARGWNYLGHAGNRFPANTPLAIPAADFPMRLRIETETPGEELLLAFATRERIGEVELRVLRDDLRRTAKEARRAGAGAAAIGERLRASLDRIAAAQALLRFRVGR